MEPDERDEVGSTFRRRLLRTPLQSIKRFNQWYVRYPSTPWRLAATMLVSALSMALLLAVVLSSIDAHSRFKADWVLWSVEYPMVFTLVQAPRQYRTARQLAGQSPDRLSTAARIIERALASIGIGAFAAMVLWFGAVHGGTALTLFPLFSAITFLMSLLIMKPSEGSSRGRIVQWRYMPMRNFLNCDENERWLVKTALFAIFAPRRSTTPLEFWSQWTTRTRSAIIEWVWLLMTLGSGLVVMMAVLVPHCVTRTNQIGFPLAALAIAVSAFMVKGLVVLRAPWRSVD